MILTCVIHKQGSRKAGQAVKRAPLPATLILTINPPNPSHATTFAYDVNRSTGLICGIPYWAVTGGIKKKVLYLVFLPYYILYY
jgi:hypothetical protein